MESATWQMFAQYGLAGLIFAGFLVVLRWVFRINDRLLKDMAEERKLYQTVQQAFTENIKEMSLCHKAFFDAVSEAHGYQREEHKEMITVLGRINGYKSST